MTDERVIYNDDFRTVISHDQPTSGFPSTAGDLAGLVERVGGTGVTTYVMDAIAFDNKVFFATQRGVRWDRIDFTKYGEDWDASYGAATRFMERLRAEGREALEVVIDSCRGIGVEVLAGARMNDCQGVGPLYPADSPDTSQFLLEHLELAIRFPGTDTPTMMGDFGQEAVREYKFAVIEELMEKFDFDGLELNWLRFPYLFQPDFICGPYACLTEGRFRECAPLMTRWMTSIRRLLDRIGAARGKQMVLGVRVPETPELNRAVGIDLPEWTRQAELDYLVPSGFITTDFNIPVERFKALCKGSDCAVYPSLFPSVCVASAARGIRAYQTQIYAAAASNYYAAGADGVEVFNHFHPPTMDKDIPSNTEALRTVSSRESAAEFPVLRYHIASSAEPPDIPGFAKATLAPTGGALQAKYDRLKFVFRFGEDPRDNGRKLDMFRFKVFEWTPEDDPPKVWLNDTAIRFDLSWRYGPVAPEWSWAYGKNDEGLELLSGGMITEEDAPRAMELLSIAPRRRAGYARQHGLSIGGPEIFMLVEADVSTIPPSALRRGVNHLWVQFGGRREDYTFDPAVGDLEIRTVR